MKRFYVAAFLVSTFAGSASAEYVTFTSGCESINVPREILQDAVDAGLFDWLAQRCEVAS